MSNSLRTLLRQGLWGDTVKKGQRDNPSDSFWQCADCIVQVYKEKMPGNGEDAYLYRVNDRAAIIGVFDGCGGAGAKRYARLQNKTGAYAASRIVSGAVGDWFAAGGNKPLKQHLRETLQCCYDAVAESSRLVSPMIKIFPTTAAFAVCRRTAEAVAVDWYWAGDSRVYLLNRNGLAQLSKDDLTVPDAMENLYDDGVMTNRISASEDFNIHHSHMILKEPGVVLTATDGCFGYVSTPMEFEYMLLSSLVESKNVEQWQQKLIEQFGKVAGDDFTLCALALGFGTFERLKKELWPRGKYLYADYIQDLQHKTQEDKTQLWNRYAPTYYRFLQRL